MAKSNTNTTVMQNPCLTSNERFSTEDDDEQARDEVCIIKLEDGLEVDYEPVGISVVNPDERHEYTMAELCTEDEANYNPEHSDAQTTKIEPYEEVAGMEMEGGGVEVTRTYEADQSSILEHPSMAVVGGQQQKQHKKQKQNKQSRHRFQYDENDSVGVSSKRYICDFCDYRTNYITTLKRHIRRHTGEKPFQCPVCEYKCKQKHSITVHIKRQHPDDYLKLHPKGE